jgi:hypothetical protein
MPIKNAVLLTLAGYAVAFGLKPQRVTQTGLKTVGQSPFSQVSHTALFQAEATAVVAAKEDPKRGALHGLWNDQTQLFSYLTVWYMGNIYCKCISYYLYLCTCSPSGAGSA